MNETYIAVLETLGTMLSGRELARAARLLAPILMGRPKGKAQKGTCALKRPAPAPTATAAPATAPADAPAAPKKKGKERDELAAKRTKQACEFLREVLASGPQDEDALEEAAAKRGVSRNAMGRAANELNVVIERNRLTNGVQGVVWSL